LRNGAISISVSPPSADLRVPPSAAKVLEKVIHNALQFTEGGSAPQVGVVGSDGPAGWTTVRVTGNGFGVESKYSYPGPGMGLAMCLLRIPLCSAR